MKRWKPTEGDLVSLPGIMMPFTWVENGYLSNMIDLNALTLVESIDDRIAACLRRRK